MQSDLIVTNNDNLIMPINDQFAPEKRHFTKAKTERRGPKASNNNFNDLCSES
jgi:hypothetical protein